MGQDAEDAEDAVDAEDAEHAADAADAEHAPPTIRFLSSRILRHFGSACVAWWCSPHSVHDDAGMSQTKQ